MRASGPACRCSTRHGHTPVDHPRIDGRRLDIDTGAFKTGRLTAVRISGKSGRLFFS
jgi:serine/threonine protein phosphatase 1